MKRDQISNSAKYAVTFEMPPEVQAATLALVGDFNDWDQTSHPLKRRKEGTWARTLRLVPGVYRYRYLADGTTWYNDWAADRYEASPHGEDNSVVEFRAA